MNKYLNVLYVFLFLVIGCSGDDNGGEEAPTQNKVTSLNIYISATETIVGQSLLFTVIDNNGVNRTNEAKFYVNNVEISGSSYLFNEVGTFLVHAKFQSVTSATKEIIVNPVPIEFKKRVLVEDYTGTWCGWCPRISYALEKLEKETNDAVIVAAHQGDPMQFNKISSLMSNFNVTGFPTGIINREASWTYPQPENVGQVTAKLSQKAYIGLAINSSLDGNNLTINTKVKIGYNYASLKLGVYIIEDSLVYDQENYTSYYGGGSVLKNFKHQNVLRESLTNILGDQIPNENVGHDKEFEKDFIYAIPSKYNNSNIKIVSFVTLGSSKSVLNVRGAKIGDDEQSIEYK